MVGVVVKVIDITDVDSRTPPSCFCKVLLENGQSYIDRAKEWEPLLNDEMELDTPRLKQDRKGKTFR